MNNANATRAANLAEIAHHTDSAAPVFEGQQVDSVFLDRLHAAWVHPDDLAAIVAYAHFQLLNTICRLARKVLEVRHD